MKLTLFISPKKKKNIERKYGKLQRDEYKTL